MNESDAIKRIKTHLNNHGEDGEIAITKNIVLYWWHILNRAIFNGELIPPKQIFCRNFRTGHLGWCCAPYSRTTGVHMGIRRVLPTRRIFLTVLVHEMVHQWQGHTNRTMNHGKSFYKWKPHIMKKIGLPLNKYVTI